LVSIAIMLHRLAYASLNARLDFYRLL